MANQLTLTPELQRRWFHNRPIDVIGPPGFEFLPKSGTLLVEGEAAGQPTMKIFLPNAGAPIPQEWERVLLLVVTQDMLERFEHLIEARKWTVRLRASDLEPYKSHK